MPAVAAALISGLLFGFGLIVSQMANPAKVLNFLDVSGHWDPSLAFVMAAAIPVTAVGYRLARSHSRPLLEGEFHLPQASRLDARMAAGALVFGLGWGLVGFCPGPALVALGFGSAEAALFVAAMIVGMILFESGEAMRRRRASPA